MDDQSQSGKPKNPTTTPGKLSRALADHLRLAQHSDGLCEDRLGRIASASIESKTSFTDFQLHPCTPASTDHNHTSQMFEAAEPVPPPDKNDPSNKDSGVNRPSTTNHQLPLGRIETGGNPPTHACSVSLPPLSEDEEQEAYERLWDSDPEEAQARAEQSAWDEYVDCGGYATTELLPQAIEEAEAFMEHIKRAYPQIIGGNRSKKTNAEYRAIAEREQFRENPFDLGDSRGPYRRKRFCALLLHIDGMLWSLTNFGRDPFFETEAGPQIVRQLNDGIRVGKKLIEDFEAGTAASRPKRKQFRQRIASLPDGWEYLLEEASRSHPKWYLPICLMLTAGLRPQDIANRVLVTPLNEDLIEIDVDPAKQRDASGEIGLGRRRVTFRTDAPWTSALLRASKRALDLRAYIGVESPKSAYNILVGISRRVFPRAVEPVTPLVLRHRFASLLKNGEYDRDTKLKALGHASPKSFRRYGAKGIRCAHVGLLESVVSEREPRGD